jgi:hypothetical protein
VPLKEKEKKIGAENRFKAEEVTINKQEVTIGTRNMVMATRVPGGVILKIVKVHKKKVKVLKSDIQSVSQSGPVEAASQPRPGDAVSQSRSVKAVSQHDPKPDPKSDFKKPDLKSNLKSDLTSSKPVEVATDWVRWARRSQFS